MTKLITVRIVVPAGDEVTTDQVREKLDRMLSLYVPAADGDYSDHDHGARIHWAAADVLRDRKPTPATKARTAPTAK